MTCRITRGAKAVCTDLNTIRRYVGRSLVLHPSVARSIALAACRTTDPEATARQYLKNYDNDAFALRAFDLKL